jgi:hypothetical protein
VSVEYPKQVLTSEAARIIGVSPTTVQWYERTGRLQATKTSNGTRLFFRDAIEQFAREREARLRTQSAEGPKGDDPRSDGTRARVAAGATARSVRRPQVSPLGPLARLKPTRPKIVTTHVDPVSVTVQADDRRIANSHRRPKCRS